MIDTAQAMTFGGLVAGGVGHPVHLALGLLAGAAIRNWRTALACAALAGLVYRLMVLILGRPAGAGFTLADLAVSLATTVPAGLACGCRYAAARARGG